MPELADRELVGLLDAAPDALVCVAADGRIVLVNAQAERLFGYRRDEMVGQQVEILVPEAVRMPHHAHRAAYVASPRQRVMGLGLELEGRRRDGSTFPVEIALSAMPAAEGLLVTAAVRDITDRKKAEEERAKLRAEAERLRREHDRQQSLRLEGLGRLAGGIAHDFNNMLGIISSYALFIAQEALDRRALDGWGPVYDDIQQIQLAAERAAALTRQLLTFGRQDMIKPRPLDLNDVVASVEKMLRRTLGENVELSAIPGRDLDMVHADPGQVEQVLVNLALNARDAMPGGGKLTIETANIDVDAAYAAGKAELSAGRHVLIKVSDTGTGMPHEMISQAFDPFFTTKPQGQGTGLGLPTVYAIITRAGGDVRIYSEIGVGTTIRILLPATGGQPAGTTPAAAERPEPGHGETILLVEDEDALRVVAERILSRNGYQVMTAASGAEAIQAAACTGPLDLLLTDVIMPGMQGPEVAERISAARPDVRVLYMSGYTEGLLGSKGILTSGVSLIEKPFSEASLLGKIRSLIDNAPA